MQIEWKKQHTAIVAAAAGGAALGFVGGYFLGKRKAKGFKKTYKKTDEGVEVKTEEDGEENVTVIDVNSKIKKEDIKDKLDDVKRSVAEHPANPKKSKKVKDNGDVPNPNDLDDLGWDYDVEVAQRTEAKPYIIHFDEYQSNEHDFSQSTLTFYAGDKILCDERDAPIYNPETIVGTLIFGHGSRDPSICFVRNHKLQAEYEILLEEGYFQTEVLGQEVEDRLSDDDLKHSKQRKFKEE